MSGFIVGMLKPAWIMRKSATPSRKKIAQIALPVLVVTAMLANVTRTPEEVAHDQQIAEEKAAAKREKKAAENIKPPFPNDVANKLCSTVATYVSGILGSRLHGESVDVEKYAARIVSEDLAGLPAQYRPYQQKLLIHFGTGMEHDPNPAETMQKYTANPTGFLAALMSACTRQLSGAQ
ncbi:hypothetical protein ACTHR6_01790 [Ralstonia holmesii]|uniref:hypothetical protein n=1 Tax=Ralstonia TaxID=48736 RepID=UPI0012686623|nr:hypothetical protein [Ralstonia pickettii]